MEIPGLGVLVPFEDGEYSSEAVPVPVFGGRRCVFYLSEDEDGREDVHAAVAAFLALRTDDLRAAEPAVFDYYQDIAALVDDDDIPVIERAGDVWGHVSFGDEIRVVREDDERIYVSVECNCDWEPEHGLQLVFRDGRTVSKVGPYDGHLTNSSAYGRDGLGDVIYVRAR